MSWSHKPLHTRDAGGTTVVTRCFVEEISLLTPSTKPAEPLARVCLVEENAVAGEIIYGRRGETIVRHGIGQVLGVR